MRLNLKNLSALAGFILLVATSLPVQAGWIEVNSDGEQNIFSKGLFKNTMPGQDGWSLMNMNDGTLTIISDSKKTYITGTTDEFCGSMSGVQDQMKAGMEQAMQGMTPEQRAMMEQMMGGGAKRPDPKVTVSWGIRSGEIAGFSTTKYTVSVDSRPNKEVWLTNDSALMKDIQPFLKKALKMSGEMSRCGSGGPGMMSGGFNVEASKEYHKLMQTGYPLREKDIRSGRTQEVKSLKTKTIPDSEFAIPTGYKKMSFSEMMQQEMRGQSR